MAGSAWIGEPDARVRIRARYEAGERPVAEAGTHALALANGREGFLRVPAGYDPRQPAPLLVMLHGAGSRARRSVDRVEAPADQYGTIVFAPQSTAQTWDILAGGFGPDVTMLDAALAGVFAQYAVDPARVALAGFSDGGSYALSLGFANGDVFPRLVAFSPGFCMPAGFVGDPGVFISHGTEDEILPIERCSRMLVPVLRRAGYRVHYVEFEGPHAVTEPVLREAYAWLARDPAAEDSAGGERLHGG